MMIDTEIAVPPAAAVPLRVALTPATQAVLGLSLLLGLAYPFVSPALPPIAAILAKGSGVALLALAAAVQGARRRWWLVSIMAAGAAGDVLLEIDGLFLAGGGAFAFGHIIAIAYYFQNRAAISRLPDKLAATGLIGWGLAMPMLVSPPGTAVGALIIYAVLLCGMASALLLSRFPLIAFAGAALFIVSDTLLIMRLGGRLIGDAGTHDLFVWLTYFIGQSLICVGVLSGLPLRATR